MARPFSKDGPDYAFAKVHGRLAQFMRWGNQNDDWQERWDRKPLKQLLAPYADGRLGHLSMLAEHLPTSGKILEAGCGQGQLVLALDARGYDVEGVDFAEHTVRRIQEAAPHLKVRVGDVYALDVPDGHYNGYISIGVFEHLVDSPAVGLRETRRVLKTGGIACIALPHLNQERRSWLGKVPEVAPGEPHRDLDFYQYYYGPDEIKRHLDEADLELVTIDHYGLYAGLTRDFLLGRFLDRKGFYADRIRRLVTKTCDSAPPWALAKGSHMAMYVCRAR